MTTFLALWLVAQAVSAALVWFYTMGLGRPVRAQVTPSIVVIVAVKGHDIELDGCLAALVAQDYPSYRVIFTVEAIDDPAVAAIRACQADLPDRISLVVAGLACDEGQKVANLRKALESVTSSDDIIVFADADIWPRPDWLRRLITPLVAGEADVASGFCWLLVKDRRLSTFVVATMSAGLATFPRLPLLNAAWGGSTALRRELLEELKIAEAWHGTLSDDLQLTNVVKRAGRSIAAPREILLRTPVETAGFGAVINVGRRWFMLFRVHDPFAYTMALIGMTFMAAGWIGAALMMLAGRIEGIEILFAALMLAVLRTGGRALLVKRLWGAEGVAENRAFLAADPFVTPLAAILNAGLAWSSLTMRRVEWAGIRYEVRGPQEVKILSRRPQT